MLIALNELSKNIINLTPTINKIILTIKFLKSIKNSLHAHRVFEEKKFCIKLCPVV